MLSNPIRDKMSTNTHNHPGSECDVESISQHQAKPDNTHLKSFIPNSRIAGKVKRMAPATTEAITAFLIDLKEFSLITSLKVTGYWPLKKY